MDEDLASINLLVTGDVQGVFYRASTLEQAQQLNLSGWVKNLADGSVEVVAEGSRYALDTLADWCKRGPPAAAVDHVSVRWGRHRDEFKTFQIVR